MSNTKTLLTEGFEKLLNHYGPRDWWPGDTPFEVMVGAILTQNTNWKNVEKAIANLKSKNVLEPSSLLELQPETLADLIRPAGYFKLKTKRLRSFLEYFVDAYDGDVDAMRDRSVYALREELLSVKGIGPETADSILLYALDKPTFVIDTYTKRILSRHDVCDEFATYDDLQDMFMSALPEDVQLFNEYHALIVETAKDFCRKNPLCDECPLNCWNR